MTVCDHSTSTSPTTLAELRERILSDLDLPEKRQRDIASALANLAKAMGRPLDTLSTDPVSLRALMANRSPKQMGFEPGRWRNIRSLLNAAMARCGLVQVPGRLDNPLSPAWAALFEKDLNKDARFRVGRFARWCSREGIVPESVDDAVLQRFGKVQETASLIDDPKRRTHDIAVLWNRAVASHPDWPQRHLTVPDNRLYYTPDWTVYPASLMADVEKYLASLAGGCGSNRLSKKAWRRPLRPATLIGRRCVLRLYLGALVLSGEDPATMVDLRSVVTRARVNAALTFFLNRTGGNATHHTAQIARLALGIARHWVDSDAEDIAQLRTWTANLTPGRIGMTEKNKRRLRPFMNEDIYERLVDLPKDLCDEVKTELRRLGAPNTALALQAQTAVLLQILLLVPLRMKNLAGLRIGTELVCLPGNKMFIILTEKDTKNDEPYDAELVEEAVALIDWYITTFRPLLNKGGDWLFPGREAGQQKSHDGLRDQISRVMADRCGVEFNPHAFRHLAGYRILLRDPSAYGMVQRVLGHKQLETTMRFYTGLETIAASRHFQNMVVNASTRRSTPSRATRRQA
jgi:integrase